MLDERYFLTKFQEIEETDNWETLFLKISSDSEKEAKKIEASYNVSMSEENFEKNRYRNVLPYDTNRIILKNDQYINASPLKIPFNERSYILTQGPLPNTQEDFWQMVFEQETSLIVMLSQIFENGQIKCEPYFPTIQQKQILLNHFNLELLEQVDKSNYIVRQIKISSMQYNTSRIIYHYQYQKWPDFDVPETSENFLEFLFEIRNCWRSKSSNDTKMPIICHCSAGIGRTGTFVVVDSIINILENKMAGKIVSSDNKKIKTMEELIVYMRRYRMGLIQTPEQLKFCWMVIVNWISKHAKMEQSNREINDSQQSTSKIPPNLETSSNGFSEKTKRLNTEQEKRKLLVENMVKKMREFDHKDQSYLRRFILNTRFFYHPQTNLIISTTCFALASAIGAYYFFLFKK